MKIICQRTLYRSHGRTQSNSHFLLPIKNFRMRKKTSRNFQENPVGTLISTNPSTTNKKKKEKNLLRFRDFFKKKKEKKGNSFSFSLWELSEEGSFGADGESKCISLFSFMRKQVSGIYERAWLGLKLLI